MSYVMVPVPEEHAAAVMRYVRWGGAKAPEADWDETSVHRLLALLDANVRNLLVCAAEAVLDAGPLTAGTETTLRGYRSPTNGHLLDTSRITATGVLSTQDSPCPAAIAALPSRGAPEGPRLSRGPLGPAYCGVMGEEDQ